MHVCVYVSVCALLVFAHADAAAALFDCEQSQAKSSRVEASPTTSPCHQNFHMSVCISACVCVSVRVCACGLQHLCTIKFNLAFKCQIANWLIKHRKDPLLL